VNEEIAEKQAKIFKQNIVPRKISVVAPPENQKTSSKEKTEKNPEATTPANDTIVGDYPHKELQNSLLFPPLCIDSSSQYDVSKASKTLAKELLKFLHSHPNVDFNLTLLDDSVNPCGPLLTKYLDTLYKKNNLDPDKRFSIRTDNLESVVKEYRFVVCPVTWRLKPNHGISRYIFKECKPFQSSLQQQVKEVHHTAKCGRTYEIILPEVENKNQVYFLVNGPNVNNAKKPNCLNGDYARAGTLLESCYSSLFQRFAAICKLE